MAKKLSPRELREQRERERQAKFAKQVQEREAEKAKREKQVSVSDTVGAAAAVQNENGKKSMAKAAGVKSVFAVGDTVYMTSFGRGNDAVLEKKIVDESHESLNKANPAYEITDISSVNYSVEGHRGQSVCATADNPLHHDGGSSVPTDMLCLKPTLERVYFGKTFDDNLHIQLIYNILDIEKILAIYSTNAVYALNNMIADEDDESSDLFQNMTTDYTYDKFRGRSERIVKSFNDFVSNPRLAYYSDAFYEKKGKGSKRRSEKEIYSMLAMLGKLRHWCVHSESGEAEFWLYKLDSLNGEFIDVLNTLYNRSVNEINRGFVDTNKVNIQILQAVCKNMDLISLIKAYYEFLITKKYKNMGFSIKKLREMMLAETAYTSNPDDRLYDKEINSVRNKLYQMTDFIIYLEYRDNKSIIDTLVSKLRSSVTDEAKEAVYREEAANLRGRLLDAVALIAKSLNGVNIKKLQQNTLEIPDSKLENCFIKSAEKVSAFTKLNYLLTRFINGKEINDLLTTLINKFDNIRSFLETMDELGLERTFTENYRFFEDSQKYRDELIELNSFAKSCSFDISAKRIMYRDALDILGIQAELSEDEIGRMIDNILQLDANGERISKNQRENGLRNFIASNVIDSNRFKYLVRYGNPKKIRETAKCTPAVKFVLDGIPDSQIERYYNSCFPEDTAICSADKKRRELAEMISNISFDWFKDAGNVQRVNAEDKSRNAEIKRKNQAIIRLYLTVMYLMLKNLVNVNSRYVIGFHCVERDAKLYKLSGLTIEGNTDKNRTLLTATILGITSADRAPSGEIVADCDLGRAETAANRHLRKKRWYVQIFNNLKQADRNVINEFRNSVCHLNAIRNINTNIEGIGFVKNYFALYHYLIQRHISSKRISFNSFSAEYISNLEKYHTPSEYFIKAYCTPFAYNLVRYKNLTIDGLFDRNAPSEK